MTRTAITATAASILALGLAFGPAPALAAKTSASIGMQLEPPNLDPTGGAAAAIDEVVYANVFEGLTRFGADGSILPALAESWEISEDGLTYTFKLRTGVTFHDGSGFDAEDVKFSLDRARADESTNAQKALFADIASVEVVDPATIKVTLSQPNGSFLFNMAWGDAVIVAPETAADNAAKPVGTGPFTFAEWVKGDRVDLARNPAYWGEPVKLETVTFKFISDPTAAFAAMMAGDLDAYPAFPAPENLVQFEADPRFAVIIGSSEGETILAMNNKKAPLDNILVRQAITHAIDRQAIIDGAMFGYGTPIGTHFAPHNPAYLDLTAQSAYDPEKSKALLEEAGVSDLTLSLKLPPPSYARRGGEIIAAQLREVGIDTEITNVEWAQWLEDVFKGKNFDLTVISHTEPMDIGIYGRDDYYFQYADPDFQAIMADLANASDPDKRTELMQAAQQKIADDYVNAYLFQLPRTGVADAKLKGLWPNSPTQANDMTGVYWEE
ncbi:MAG: ABC transporter substrate-binding protein [Hoeflea sp.]|uniref:ABC transporter substrate-binding protein n=1 Tax=Hoeflea sp. TaxID=1940281 RepID=UPI001DE641A9|nr:ABC transporter substrate-binding protein [Hoeflea sp.]MBU4531695.1 ABC transporter substrate-binding protein [Alphaproteobacteria bacterium]MBU4544551.1 ABC transporter substrate-binding protein [Alphaproteobacteria bacterium]MBU4552782.1 ABC transporter substrate-binding protein [Alphaproteobacteria bacterium]MBV1724971.1 ABC transporter substrate-binding protein [Hoeflea sp.]MBV1760991.1 ABC transporter substrate-binding protein [Hoeflea sp.]